MKLGYNSKEDMEIAANRLKIWERFGYHSWEDMELVRKMVKLIDNKDQYKELYDQIKGLVLGEAEMQERGALSWPDSNGKGS